MHKVNKILILFLIIILVSFAGIWQFIQSEFFAKSLSSSITEYTKVAIGADIKFDKVEFNLFPPAARINNVKFNYKKNKSSVAFHLNSLGIFFSISDSFKTNLTIQRVLLDDGKVNISVNNENKNQTSEKKFLLKESISSFFDILSEKLPTVISNINLKDILININNDKFYVSDSVFSFKKDFINVKLNSTNYELFSKPMYNKLFDQLSLELEIFKDKAVINKLELMHKLSKFVLSGKMVFGDTLDDTKIKINTKGQFDVADTHDFFDFKSIGKLNEGLARVNCNSLGSVYSVQTSCAVNVENLNSSFAYAKDLDFSFNVGNKSFLIKSLSLKDKEQNLMLIKPFILYDFQTKRFIDEKVSLRVKSFKFDNALRYLNKSLYPLKGEMTGDFDFILGTNDFHFIIKDNLRIDNLKVIPNPASPDIISMNFLTIEKGQFDIVNNDFKMNILAVVNESSFEVDGEVAANQLKFTVNNGYFDFSDFNNFAGFTILGKGTCSVNVFGPLDDIKIDLDTDLRNFSFNNYNLEKVMAQLRFDLNTSSIIFKNIKSSTSTSTLTGNGILNYDTLEVDVVASHEKINLMDLLKIYNPLLSDYKTYLEDIYGKFNANINITGKTNFEDLVINTKFESKNLNIYGESFDETTFNLILNERKLLFDNIELVKGKGKVFAATSIDLSNSFIKVNGNILNLSIHDLKNYSKLPFDLSTELNSSFRFEYKNKIELIDVQAYFNKSKALDQDLNDSFVSLNYINDIVKFEGNIFGESLKVNSLFNLKESSSSNELFSRLSVNTNIDNLSSILGAVRGIEKIDDTLKSDIKIKTDVRFNFQDTKKITGTLIVNNFVLSRSGIEVNYRNDQTNIVVNNGLIKKWDINVKGKKFYLISSAKGNFSTNYDLLTKLKIDASIAEVFNKLITKSSGELIAQLRSFKNNINHKSELYFLSNNLSLSSNILPTAITDSDIRIMFKKNKLFFEKFSLDLSKGSLVLDGEINLNKFIPQVNINYLIEDAGIVIFDKSSLIASGKGSLIGESVPYILTGDIVINKANIINEVNDFGGADDIVKKDIKYLPLSKESFRSQLLNFNLGISTSTPIRILNSRMDIGMEGNVQLTGSESNPRLSGKFALASLTNKVYFQNHEYKVSKANIYFNQSDLPTNPELDILATSNISNNIINIRVYGRLSDYKINLSSDPSMSQESILSLIAFGYSEDISGDLSETEKESITRAGVGSILFESFKINETLKNEFGLQIDLGTQISKDEGSYLNRRDSDGSSGLGRLRSATTIEIKKKISDAMSMSMTSTVGSSAGQRQLMNVNYNINKTYSVEGIFEKRTSAEGDQDNVDNSFGADLKMKWSFK